MQSCRRLGHVLIRNRFSSLETVCSGKQAFACVTHVQDRSLRTEFHRRRNTTGDNMSQAKEGWQTFGKYEVYAWSVSGLETCVVLQADDLKVAFDMGHAIQQSISCANVFISHGHTDHVGGVANHVSKRGLFGMKKAKYFVPPILVDHLRTATEANFAMAVTTTALHDVHILPIDTTDTVMLPGNYSVRAFPTAHRIPSQGYILYKTVKKLKPQYVGQPSSTIAEMARNNVEIHDFITTPEVAYTGDTMIDVFLNPPSPDLLRVKLLITEATFIDLSDKKDNMKKAKDRGHTHLKEIIDNAHLFKEVENILLIHFSNQYSPSYITQCVSDTAPSELRDKIQCATIAKQHIS